MLAMLLVGFMALALAAVAAAAFMLGGSAAGWALLAVLPAYLLWLGALRGLDRLLAGGVLTQVRADERARAAAPACVPLSAGQRLLRLRCPHCGHAAMPAWRKWLLGWNHGAACQACGQAVRTNVLRIMVVTAPLIAVPLGMAVLHGLGVRLRVPVQLAVVAGVAWCALAGGLFGVNLLRAARSRRNASDRKRKGSIS